MAVAVAAIATWAFAGQVGAHPGMSCNPEPGHGSPGCHRDEATTTTAAPATTTTKPPTTTTKPTTSTTRPSTKPSTSTTNPATPTTKPSTTTTAGGSSATGATTSTSGKTTSTVDATTSTTGGLAPGDDDTTPTNDGTSSEDSAPTTASIPAALTSDVDSDCNTCHEGVGPEFAASMPDHVHSNAAAVRAIYDTKTAFSILTGSILAVGMLVVAMSIILRGFGRYKRRAALRKKGL